MRGGGVRAWTRRGNGLRMGAGVAARGWRTGGGEGRMYRVMGGGGRGRVICPSLASQPFISIKLASSSLLTLQMQSKIYTLQALLNKNTDQQYSPMIFFFNERHKTEREIEFVLRSPLLARLFFFL